MEWGKAVQHHPYGQNHALRDDNLSGNVMTDEQLETLRKQIAAYAIISEQLVEMHNTLTPHQDHLTGMRLGNMYCDPLMTSSAHRITSRQRWTPTPLQLQILERIFEQGNGTPSKQKIKEITTELGQHGQISESNVYNWFQNRRARSKRRQQNTTLETEVETDVKSPKDEKAKLIDFQSHQAASASLGEDMCFQSPDQMISELHFLDPNTNKADTLFSSNGSSKAARSFGRLPFYEGNERLIGKVETSENYSLYQQQQAQGYNMTAERS